MASATVSSETGVHRWNCHYAVLDLVGFMLLLGLVCPGVPQITKAPGRELVLVPHGVSLGLGMILGGSWGDVGGI